jgi:hypothetical protein
MAQPEPLHSWYLERPEGCTAQPTLHQHAEKNHLTFTGLEGKQVVWVKNEGDEEFAMCCYYKSGFCDFNIVKPEKRGTLGFTITRHVHAFASCSVCGYCVPLPRSKSKIEFSQCFQCKEVLERTKVLNAQTQESVLKIREEALMLEHLLQGEALRRKGDELRLQQKSLDKATKDHKKAQEEQVKNIATSFQGKRTNRFSLRYTNKY